MPDNRHGDCRVWRPPVQQELAIFTFVSIPEIAVFSSAEDVRIWVTLRNA